MTANQVGQRGGQIWAEAVAADVGRDGGTCNGLAGRTGACVSLIFANLRDQRGQFGDLMPRGFGVSGSGFLGPVVAAAAAGGRHQGEDLPQTLGRQASLQRRGMSGLAAGFFAGGLFDDGFGWLGRISRGGQRGIGGVLGQLLFEQADAVGQGGKLLL